MLIQSFDYYPKKIAVVGKCNWFKSYRRNLKLEIEKLGFVSDEYSEVEEVDNSYDVIIVVNPLMYGEVKNNAFRVAIQTEQLFTESGGDIIWLTT